MMRQSLLLLTLAFAIMLQSCEKSLNDELQLQQSAQQAILDSQDLSLLDKGERITVTTGPHKLQFYGWGMSNDKIIPVVFPKKKDGPFKKVLLRYVMGCADGGCSDWDNTTIVSLKIGDQFFELARAFTPYGGLLDRNFKKEFVFDVTDYLPYLRDTADLKIYYGGFDATATRYHTVSLNFDFIKGQPEKKTVLLQRIYDSETNGNSGYRGFAYGVSGYSIEDVERMGPRTIEIPKKVKSLALRISITGHGHDQGKFPDRPNYQTKNSAEFDENYYYLIVNGAQQYKGTIFQSCATNYPQAGTYSTDRANWCPGNPGKLEYWELKNIPEHPFTFTMDMNLDRFISQFSQPNAEGVAQYIVHVDLIGYDEPGTEEDDTLPLVLPALF
ncbi:hypothetical protein OB13_03760 [Pontibacter sp. HJ8]